MAGIVRRITAGNISVGEHEVVQLGCYQMQVSAGYGGEIFTRTEAEIDRQNLDEILGKQARQDRFKSGMDWLLCHLYPQFEDECRLYYRRKGKDFKTGHPRLVRKVDLVMVVCLRESAKRAKESTVSRLGSGNVGT